MKLYLHPIYILKREKIIFTCKINYFTKNFIRYILEWLMYLFFMINHFCVFQKKKYFTNKNEMILLSTILSTKLQWSTSIKNKRKSFTK